MTALRGARCIGPRKRVQEARPGVAAELLRQKCREWGAERRARFEKRAPRSRRGNNGAPPGAPLPSDFSGGRTTANLGRVAPREGEPMFTRKLSRESDSEFGVAAPLPPASEATRRGGLGGRRWPARKQSQECSPPRSLDSRPLPPLANASGRRVQPGRGWHSGSHSEDSPR
jgi:hypothetical protein